MSNTDIHNVLEKIMKDIGFKTPNESLIYDEDNELLKIVAKPGYVSLNRQNKLRDEVEQYLSDYDLRFHASFDELYAVIITAAELLEIL